jgi:hypothetical protein
MPLNGESAPFSKMVMKCESEHLKAVKHVAYLETKADCDGFRERKQRKLIFLPKCLIIRERLTG